MEARGCSSRAGLPAVNNDPWSEVKIRLAHHRHWLRTEHPEWGELELDLEARAALLAVEMMLCEQRNVAPVPAEPQPEQRVRVRRAGRCWSFLCGCLWLKADPQKGRYHGYSRLVVAIWAGFTGWVMLAAHLPAHSPASAPPPRAAVRDTAATAEDRVIDFILQHAPARRLRADHLVDDLSAQFGQDSDFVQQEIAAGRMGFDEKSGRLFKR